MNYYIFDCETDGLLDSLTKIHSLVVETPEGMVSCHDHGADMTIEEGLKALRKAVRDGGTLVAHNGFGFDLRAIRKVFPQYDLNRFKLIDTLVLSRLAHPDLFDTDYKLIRQGKLPPKLRGSHGLKAWGFRLGVYKGDFGDTTDWSEWSPEMQSYCEQDVVVTKALLEYFHGCTLSPRAVELEMNFAAIISLQEEFGFRFNVEKASSLYLELVARREDLDNQLRDFFEPWYVNAGNKKPKVNNGPRGITKGVPYTAVKLNLFNPASRQHIANRLQVLYGWQPTEFTEGGQPKVDETVLKNLSYPPCEMLAERFLVEKRIGQLAEGAAGWLKLEKKGRIHGKVNTIGAVTGRCTHNSPNVAQTPSVSAPYGAQCRELFEVDPGYVLVGADASGLELRCLAHYMAAFDGGEYGRILLEGDIHTANQEAAGLPTRNNAKTFISLG
ncbi:MULTISPECIES: DNA polymerase, partial [unclassified Thioalkalivibrio]|uniref:DNA polymerase n=1 Tax=unclassified Thioalkalivibrio TaxID=2621013 RepID=UPI0003A3CDF5